jgi:uncharacterized protein YndB with AHSA1/START domain
LPEVPKSASPRSRTTIHSDPTLSVFAFFAHATPARVWRCLTDAAQTSSYLEGMALQSDWVEGSAILATFGGEPTALGEVLCVRTHYRLSYVIQPPAASAVYLTWLLRPRAEGCICRLQIDETDGSDLAELEDVWLPILAGLQRCVAALGPQVEI